MASSSERQPRHYDNGQLIEFVRPVHTDIRPWGQQPASETLPLISGDEARSFYEHMCAGDESVRQEKNNTTTSQTSNRKRKRDSKHQTKKLKRLLREQSSLHDEDCGKNQTREVTLCSNDINHLDPESCSGCTSVSDTSASKSSTSTSVKFSSNSQIIKSSTNKRIRDHRQSELFRMAQNGKTEDVRKLLQKDVDVNYIDQFGWTATMSAAFEGHVGVVQILVNSGADLTIRNKQGHTALSLAQKNGHSHVVQFIESFQRTGFSTSRSTKEVKECIRFYCDVCKSEFSDSDQKAHKSSMVHIFNLGQKPKDDMFIIPPSNVGYRLMMKTGWDGNRGLGPCGDGHRYPVKTVLKQDRRGLGNEVKYKAKVTHFKAHDKSAITRMQSEGDRRVASARTLSRRAQRAKERKERQWEISMRQQLA